MHLSYKKLWKLLIDKNMNKTMLREQCNISSASVAKLVKGENITTEVLVKICAALHCDIGDICSVVDDDEKEISENKEG
jgi:putative transcriptional regulator